MAQACGAWQFDDAAGSAIQQRRRALIMRLGKRRRSGVDLRRHGGEFGAAADEQAHEQGRDFELGETEAQLALQFQQSLVGDRCRATDPRLFSLGLVEPDLIDDVIARGDDCAGSAEPARTRCLSARRRGGERRPHGPVQSLLEGRSEAESAGEAPRLVARGGGHIHMLAVSHGPYLQHLASDPLVGFSQTISVRVGNDADFVWRENMVISIEVFLSRRGVGHAGFENNVIVTRDGAELLSRTPMLM
jgi:hypothetical protein